MTAAESGDVAGRPVDMPEPLTVVPGSVPADVDADQAVTALYAVHYRSLVRLAELLVRDLATAEEVVQESFVAMHSRWRRLGDREVALSYLRKSVVNQSRSVLRRRGAAGRHPPPPTPGALGTEPRPQTALPPALAALSDEPGAVPEGSAGSPEELGTGSEVLGARPGATAGLEPSAVIAALDKLPARQREALVLRYYGDLSEAQVASTMGISTSAVQKHTARARSALSAVLECLA
jgi:DNA-directed RNA polymerase specialized sigma24 family protein